MPSNLSSIQTKQLLWADIDNDGDQDFFHLTYGGVNQLFINENGTYIESTHEYGLPNIPMYSFSATWADYNRDGWIDLFVSNRISLTHYLFRNRTDGTFQDVSAAAGIDTIGEANVAAFVDYNNDQWPDIYIVNDRHEGNILYKNHGDGTFTNVAPGSGADIPLEAMSIAPGDFENDGDLDFYITNTLGGHAFIRNNGDGTFTNIAPALGMEVFKIGWGANFFDYDNDGFMDLFVSTQAYNPPPTHGGLFRNPLFRNQGNGTFVEMSGVGTDDDSIGNSFGNAIGDFNNDGFYDLAVLNSDTTWSRIYRNNGGSNHWIKLRLEGTISTRDATGTWIRVVAGGDQYHRYTTSGSSYCSQNTADVIIGLGSHTMVDTLAIQWLSSPVEIFTNIPVDQVLNIVEWSASTLPIAGLNFQAKWIDNAISLQWRGTQEPYVSHYLIEKSLDGKNFSLFKTVNATLAQAQYEHIDLNPYYPKTYYRIQQVFEDGSSQFSSIINVKSLDTPKWEVTLFPNPVFTHQAFIDIHIQSPQETPYSLQLLDQFGRIVFENNHSLQTGENILPVSIKNLASGIYFLKIESPTGSPFKTIYKKLVVKIIMHVFYFEIKVESPLFAFLNKKGII